jgi:type II secretory pathway predicted ATPase ExeA
MYNDYYGFRHKPFQLTPDPGRIFLSPSHKKALTYLEYGFMESASIIVLTGEIGTGKTTLVRHIQQEYADKFQTTLITNTNVTPDELLELMLLGFGIEERPTSKPQRLERLRSYFSELDTAGRKALLIIDDAQNLSTAALEEIRMLFSLEDKPHTGLQVFLVGQAELRARLQAPELMSLAQRVGVNFHLAPLETREVAEYILYRIQEAGGSKKLFDARALARIAMASGGIPRAINQLCDAALVYGYGYGQKTIGQLIINHVIADRSGFGLVADKKSPPPPSSTAPTELQALSERVLALEASVAALTAQMGEKDRGASLPKTADLERQLIGARRHLAMEKNKRIALQKKIKALKQLMATAGVN